MILRNSAEPEKFHALSAARILLYCAVGERSTLAVEIASEKGLKNIAHLRGGFKQWQRSGGAVEVVDL